MCFLFSNSQTFPIRFLVRDAIRASPFPSAKYMFTCIAKRIFYELIYFLSQCRSFHLIHSAFYIQYPFATLPLRPRIYHVVSALILQCSTYFINLVFQEQMTRQEIPFFHLQLLLITQFSRSLSHMHAKLLRL